MAQGLGTIYRVKLQWVDGDIVMTSVKIEKISCDTALPTTSTFVKTEDNAGFGEHQVPGATKDGDSYDVMIVSSDATPAVDPAVRTLNSLLDLAAAAVPELV